MALFENNSTALTAQFFKAATAIMALTAITENTATALTANREYGDIYRNCPAGKIPLRYFADRAVEDLRYISYSR